MRQMGLRQNYIVVSILSFSAAARMLYWKSHCYGNYNFKKPGAMKTLTFSLKF